MPKPPQARQDGGRSIDEATLRRMLQHAYGAELAPTGEAFASPLVHGWGNTLYRARLANGQDVVLKIAPPPERPTLTHERDMMRAEVEALLMIAEHTNVPVPSMHHHDDTHEVLDAEWFAMSWLGETTLEDAAPRLTAQQFSQLQRSVGACNRELNTITGDGFGRFLQPTMASWHDAFSGIFEDALADGQRLGVDLGVSYEFVHHVFLEHSAVLDAVQEPVFCEWDLWPSDVVVADGQVAGLIDHERAFWGDPLMEAIFAGCTVPGLGDPGELLRGYGRGPLDESERARRLLYDLFLFLVRAIIPASRGTSDAAGDRHARQQLAAAIERLRELG